MSRKFDNNKCTDSLYSLYLLLIVCLCICSCTSENNIFDNDNTKLLNFSVSVPEWKNNDSSSDLNTRAMPVSGSSLDKASSFNLIADVYDGTKNYSTIIKDETVSYTNNMWKTVASHYWPGVATKTVSFYAYYPTSISSSITHTAGSAPSLSYTVQSDAANQIDIMTATGNKISGNTNSSTPLAFNHIFAAVKFAVGTNGLPSGTVKSITISGINNSGTYTFSSGWTLGSTTTSFTVSPSTVITGSAGANITSDAFTMMMIPQTFSNASVTLLYNNGTTFSTTISGAWNAGSSYTYNLSKTIVSSFGYTGSAQIFTAPYAGTYKLEVWGAAGGAGWADGIKAYGGYSYGNIKLNTGQLLYVFVGQYQDGPVSPSPFGCYNGGGLGQAPGGGATHIATTSRGELKNYASYQNEVLIVAGGGGGVEWGGNGGSGGGISGSSGKSEVSGQPVSASAPGGSQTSGGTSVAPDLSVWNGTNTLINASFGQGGCGYTSTSDYGAGGGGGWYGGGGTSYSGAAGGGSGHLGASLISGTTGMTNGICSDAGHATITYISAN
ncbi:fimbrillin family protein [Xylanibacter oryzae]|uniref:fimbrillin family protein n=1 Tax=Xylanibacter oryzae TaxID=185293 RepID=UPI0004B1986E|nr:fimbrillin family protein [Xylanibacter oryzae]